MAKCPNCGQETKRTEDWCCQWCGYPLLSGSYKRIKKTYRELKEERMPQQPVIEEAEAEPASVLEFEPEEAVEVEEEVVEPEEEVEPEEVPEPEPEAEVVEEPVPKAKRKPAAKREPATRTEPVPEVEPESSPEAIEITVEELLSAYATEGAAADARFANQILMITGVVDRIEIKTTLDIYYITLTGAEPDILQNVRCTFDRTQRTELEQLIAGQTVTVQGRYDGSIIDISLRDCFLVR